MHVVLFPLLSVVSIAIQLYTYALIVMAVLSWLMAFGIVNTRNRFVYGVADFLNRITEPALRPIRRVMPFLGGVDLSPIILILILYFIQRVLTKLVYSIAN